MTGSTSIQNSDDGTVAKVNKRNQLNVAATSEPQAVVEALRGAAFLATTGVINLTSANYSHMIYIKNTESVQWVIEVISGTFGTTDGTGDVLMQFTINPTGGTLVTAGTAFTPANLNFGGGVALAGVFTVGEEGSTISGGFSAAPALIPEGVALREFPGRPLILAPGSSLAMGVKPPTGNTSMNIQLQIPIHRELS